MINNRQAGRRRGRGGQQQRSSGGGNPGRQDTGNRIDNRARGNAAQLLEKYKTLARDAQMQGDRVNVEYYLQFADHYFRVLAETRARFEENGGAVSTRRIQGATLDEDEPDYEEEERAAEQPRADQQRNDQQRNDQPRNDQQRIDQQRGEQSRSGQNGNQQNGYRQEGRQDGNRQDGGRQDGNRQDGNRSYSQNGDQQRGNQNGQQNGQQNGASEARGGQDYEERPRPRSNDGYERGVEGARDERQPRTDRYERQDRVARPPAQAQAEQAQPEQARPERAQPERAPERAVEASAPTPDVPIDAAAVAEAPRRGRPRRDAMPAPVVSASDDDAGFEGGFTADRLPPSLGVSAVVPSEPANDHEQGEEAVEKPRKRRGRPPGSGATTVG